MMCLWSVLALLSAIMMTEYVWKNLSLAHDVIILWFPPIKIDLNKNLILRIFFQIEYDPEIMMMEEVVLEGEVEGGGSLNNKKEEKEERLSGSILKDDSIVLFEADDEEEENDEKDLLGGAPDLEEDQKALKATVTTLQNSTTFKHQEEDSSKGLDSGVNQASDNTIVQLLSKQQLTDDKTADEENKLEVEEEDGGNKNEVAEDQKLVIELLRQQVAQADAQVVVKLFLISDCSIFLKVFVTIVLQ